MRIPILVAIVVLVVACHDPGPHARFAVRGTVTGLDGATVTLLIDTQPAAPLSDGSFDLPSYVLDGSLYTIAIGGISDSHSCFFSGTTAPRGTVMGADLVMVIQCGSSNARLSAIDTSVGPVLETDIPNTTSFTTAPVGVLPIFGDTVVATITPTTQDAQAQVFVNGNFVTSGTPSMAISLTTGDDQVPISVSLMIGGVVQLLVHIPGVPELRLAPPQATADQAFGTAVAMSLDDTLAIGAPGDGVGAVLVFARLGAT